MARTSPGLAGAGPVLGATGGAPEEEGVPARPAGDGVRSGAWSCCRTTGGTAERTAAGAAAGKKHGGKMTGWYRAQKRGMWRGLGWPTTPVCGLGATPSSGLGLLAPKVIFRPLPIPGAPAAGAAAGALPAPIGTSQGSQRKERQLGRARHSMKHTTCTEHNMPSIYSAGSPSIPLQLKSRCRPFPNQMHGTVHRTSRLLWYW